MYFHFASCWVEILLLFWASSTIFFLSSRLNLTVSGLHKDVPFYEHMYTFHKPSRPRVWMSNAPKNERILFMALECFFSRSREAFGRVDSARRRCQKKGRRKENREREEGKKITQERTSVRIERNKGGKKERQIKGKDRRK